MSKEHIILTSLRSDLDAAGGGGKALCDVKLFNCQVQYFCLEIMFISSYYYHKMFYVQCYKFQVCIVSTFKYMVSIFSKSLIASKSPSGKY